MSVAVTCANDTPVVDLNGLKKRAGVDFAATFTEGTPAVIVDAANLDGDRSRQCESHGCHHHAHESARRGAGDADSHYDRHDDHGHLCGAGLNVDGVDTLAHYQQVLRTVTYNNTSQNPNTTARVVTFVGNDGTIDSATATSTVTVATVNDAPTFTKGADQTVLEDAGVQTVGRVGDGHGRRGLGSRKPSPSISPEYQSGLFSAGPTVTPQRGH